MITPAAQYCWVLSRWLETLNLIIITNYSLLITNLYYVRQDGSDCIVDDIAGPHGEQAEAGHTGNEADDGNALVPGGIGQLQVVRVLHLAIQYLTNNISNEPTKMVISAMKPEKPGRPRLAKPATT